MMIGEALVKEVSEDFWRLEIGSGDDRLVWYGLSKKDVENKFAAWTRNSKAMGETTRRRCTPTRVASHLAHLE